MKKLLGLSSVIITVGIVSGFALFGTGNQLALDIPIIDMKGSMGKCRIEVLDPDDNSIGTAYRYIYVDKNNFTLPISIKLTQKVEDRDVLRVKVMFKKHEQIYSLYQLQDRMIVKILGQDEYIKGTAIAYRIVVRNQRTNEPIQGAEVKVVWLVNGKEKEVFRNATDRGGTCTTDFNLPDDVESADVRFEIASSIGKDTYETRVKLASGYVTYLVTDKPIYQPGQTIHIRSLSLHKPELGAVGGKDLIFEVEDSKGNKVLKKPVTTDEYGTAYTGFVLADEVNFGMYTIRALLHGEKVEKTVKVERYVLPKFRIEARTDRDFYLPGETMSIDMNVQYFFGKPVTDAPVTITVYRFDIGFQQEAVLKALTNAQGTCGITYTLPEYFVGEPLEKGDAFVRLDIEVTDKAKHSEKISLKKKIVQDIIKLSIVPEGGSLKPHLENRIYVLAQYPDGTPCVAQVEMEIDGTTMTDKTDAYGLAAFTITPKREKTEIRVRARDDRGEVASLDKSFALDVNRDQIIVRMARGIYNVGDDIQLQFLATKSRGSIYLDVIKDNQTVLTKSIAMNGGRGNYTLHCTPDLTGSLWLHAYLVTPGGDIVRDTRFCYVHAANDLVISIRGSKDEYAPGDDGDILFTVKGKDGRPRVAALCVAIVDEAVFAVSELQPGLEKVYFMLEKEILKPRYEIHGFTPEMIVEKSPEAPRAENVLFSTLTPKEPFPVHYTTPQVMSDKFQTVFYQKLATTRDKIYAAINQYYTRFNEHPKSDEGIALLIAERFLKEGDVLDPWARKYRIETPEEYLYWFTIVSAGPDGVFDNGDDISERGLGWEEFDAVREALPMAGAAVQVKGVVKKEAEAAGPGEEPRIREFFPETFVFEPALITDTHGEAKLSLTMPDAITTWRITTFASSRHGELGSVLAQLKVFQEFFVDIDVPVSLTQGDEIWIPVAMYNYLPRDQEIRVVLQEEEWFDILEHKETKKLLKRDDVSVVYFPIRVKKIGNYTLLVKAYGEVKSDAIKRRVLVVPDGKRFEDVIADRLSGTVSKDVVFPVNAIQGANTLILKIFPGIYSQVVEGLDKLLGVPFGCFEQTTSVTYPNILILDYLRQTNQIKPDIEMAAEEYISLGYQRLVSFEVDGGGFSWFGDAPANKVLTAYGLMEFNDMSKVFEVDERVIQRTADWLKSKQNKDGSWSPDEQYLHEESWGRIQKNEILPTAYICWALGEAKVEQQSVSRGLAYLKKNLASVRDPYMLALVANACVANEPAEETTAEVLKKLVSLAKEQDGALYWESDIPSITFSRGAGADIEATGLAAYALVRSGKHSDAATKALTYLIRSKAPDGLWYTTQGTIIALRSLVTALKGMAEDIDARIVVAMNGKEIQELEINKDNADVMHQIDLTGALKEKNSVEITMKGKGNFLYEITKAYYIAWEALPRPVQPAFNIGVNYNRTKLAVNDIVDVDVSIKLNRSGIAHMVIVDLGIPPGFEVQTPLLDELVGKKIQKYSLTPRQLIIYLDEISSDRPVSFSYSIKAKYPLRAKVRSSRVYEYYNTTDEGVEEPVQMKVTL